MTIAMRDKETGKIAEYSLANTLQAGNTFGRRAAIAFADANADKAKGAKRLLAERYEFLPMAPKPSIGGLPWPDSIKATEELNLAYEQWETHIKNAVSLAYKAFMEAAYDALKEEGYPK